MKRYSVVDLNSLTGSDVTPFGINERGHVCGVANPSVPSAGGGFLWSPDKGMNLFGGLGASEPFSSGLAADPTGAVVGFASAPPGRPVRAFAWTQSGGIRDLGALANMQDALALDINDNEKAVGQSWGASGDQSFGRACKWDMRSKTIHDLGTLQGMTGSMATAINNKEQVVGASFSIGDSRAVMWPPGGQIQYLGNLGRDFGGSSDINESGHVVGTSGTANGESHAFFWKPGTGMTDLGKLAGDDLSDAMAINANDIVVGWSGGPGWSRAVLWEDGSIVDLNYLIPDFPGWQLQVAQDINSNGQIVGYGLYNNESHGFLLTPVEAPRLPIDHATFSRILTGIVADSGGIVMGPHGPILVPPWGPEMSNLPTETLDILIGLALDRIASGINNEERRQRIQKAISELYSHREISHRPRGTK